MPDSQRILRETKSILLVDWPSRDVPDTLVRAGYAVSVKGGPEPDNYSAYELVNGEIAMRRVGHPPERAELVYSHRPIEELAAIVALAQSVGATALWLQSGRSSDDEKDPKGCWLPQEQSEKARAIVESAGLVYVDDMYIADAVRRLGAARG